MSKPIEMLGRRFGRLVVAAFHSNDALRQRRWYCACDCGTTVVVLGSSLRKPNGTKSCGCIERDRPNRLDHGHARKGQISRTYKSWQMMLRRCAGYTPVHKSRYTDRGIKVCDRWRDFENFLADMGERPIGMSIDRINNDGNYEPSNCRWADRFTQSRNRSNVKSA